MPSSWLGSPEISFYPLTEKPIYVLFLERLRRTQFELLLSIYGYWDSSIQLVKKQGLLIGQGFEKGPSLNLELRRMESSRVLEDDRSEMIAPSKNMKTYLPNSIKHHMCLHCGYKRARVLHEGTQG